MFTGLLQYFLVLIVGIFGMFFLIRFFNQKERRYLWASFAVHSISSVFLVFVMKVIYRKGDLLLYHRTGAIIARKVLSNPESYLPALVQLLFRGDPYQYQFVFGHGKSTGVMSAISGFCHLAWGDSILATCLMLGYFGFLGKVALYLGFKENLPSQTHTRALFAVMFVPSVVFWTSGLVKEAVAMGGIGVAVYGLHLLVHRTRLFTCAILLIIGVGLLGLIKPYVLFPLGIAGALWFMMNTGSRKRRVFRIKIWHVIVGGIAAIATVAALGTIYQDYSVDTLGEQTARLQDAYRRNEAGSSIEMGDPSEKTLIGQLKYAPIAFVSTLLRPFIFEAHSGLSIINAIETTVALIFVLYLFTSVGVRKTFRSITSNPFLIFLFVFVTLFAVAVGLAAPNLGTLSRYRVPMYPAYWLLLLILTSNSKPGRFTPKNYGETPSN